MQCKPRNELVIRWPLRYAEGKSVCDHMTLETGWTCDHMTFYMYDCTTVWSLGHNFVVMSG